LYGELAEASAFERHLAECSACRERLEATRRAMDAVDRAGLDAAPPQVVEAVISGVAAELRPVSKRVADRRWLRAAAALAACLLVAVLGTWVYVLTNGKDPVPPAVAGELELETKAVAAEAESVLHLLDELEKENGTLVQLLGLGAENDPGIEPDEGNEEGGPT
jgi:anti-sigma factor RsiW